MQPRKNKGSRRLNRGKIVSVRPPEKAAADVETGAVVAVADDAANACPNPSLPGQPLKPCVPINPSERIVPTGQNEALVRKEASVPNMVRRRVTNRSCCLESRSRNISVSRRGKRERNRGRLRRILPPGRPLPPHFPRMSHCSPSRKRSSKLRFRNPKTGQEARPRTLRPDRPNGIASKNVCTRRTLRPGLGGRRGCGTRESPHRQGPRRRCDYGPRTFGSDSSQ